ncbi:MAG: nucleoside kinase [bacterium]|nr:nucleoside kinase [bacterium]
MATEMITIELDGRRIEVASGITVLQYLEQAHPTWLQGDNPVSLASINGRRTPLAEPLSSDERVRLIRLRDPQAQSTIQRTVQFVAAVAAEQLFPENPLYFHFSYDSGMYCELERPEPLSVDEIALLENRMRDLVAQDLPLTPQRFGLRALLKILRRNGDERAWRSAKYLRRDTLVMYRMEGARLMYYGRQLPSTGYLKAFHLVPEAPGFVLLTNEKGRPETVPAFRRQPKLLETLREDSRWVDMIGVPDTGHLNQHIVDGRTGELIQVAEARHNQFFVEAAQRVAGLPLRGRLVLLAGPSSSGKTSSAKRLMVQLRVLGLKPFALSLDNYFVDREATPRGPDGDFDFEALGALKIDLFNHHLEELLAGREVHLPEFDFRSGTGRESATATRLAAGQPLIVEGIHALNPALTASVAAEDKLQIYVSALSHLNIDSHSYIKTTHSRLFRRIVRDAQYRGYTASQTLARWPKVRQGEELHIFPFQNNADLFFNSGLTYELPVLKLWAEPRLAGVEPDDPFYWLARTLIEQLSLLLPIDASQVPPTSILREFIGGSSFDY